jgi:hypothetical protein
MQRRKGRHDMDKRFWLALKMRGVRAGAILDPLPVGSEFTLRNVERAYCARYVKEDSGLWSQVRGTTGAPHVVNIDAQFLGFCVGVAPIVTAILEEDRARNPKCEWCSERYTETKEWARQRMDEGRGVWMHDECWGTYVRYVDYLCQVRRMTESKEVR